MSSTQLHIRQMKLDDIDCAMSLKDQVGWNQTPDDIRRLVEYEPEGCFIAEIDRVPVGTVSTTSYGTKVAWIGMMLVLPEYRRRGIARRLMETSIDYLRGRNVTCIKLDATPLGQPLYEQLGFHAEWGFQRWEREGDEVASFPPDGALSAELLELDEAAFGADRSKWLTSVGAGCRVFTTSSAFGMLRPGSVATYLGPIVSQDASAVEPMVAEMLATVAGRVFWDIPTGNVVSEELAARYGFQPVRQLLRMWSGAENVSGRPDLQFALLDPTTG
ncbi:MAG: GNAT superfamily N-acetyltransferase [Planctomycetaceae bacterium]|jgi:GNAT superfamily N-acetyltransferase